MSEARRNFRFVELSDEEFEELCFLLAHIEIEGLQKTAAPDGGLDAVQLDGDGPAPRGIQAKRFSGGVGWKKCERSLDDAVETYGVGHVTFIFARNLTVNQIKLFQKRLAARHGAVRVNYWDAGQLTSKLLASARGQRVARHIFGDDEFEELRREMRANRELDTAGQAIEALGAVSNQLSNDPYFDYSIGSRPKSAPELLPPSGSILRVEIGDGESISHIDAIATEAARAAGRLPRARFEIAEKSARESFEHLMRDGGELRLSGVGVEFEQLPKHFEEFFEGVTKAEVLIRPPQEIPTLEIGVEVNSDGGRHSSSIELSETAPEPGWQHTYQGSRDGVALTMSLREGRDGAELNVNWTWTMGDGTDARQRLAGLEQMQALSGKGTVRFTNPQNGETVLEGATPEGSFGEELAGLRQIFADLVALEEWLGEPIPLGEEMDGAEATELHRVVELIGGREVDWNRLTLSASEPKDPELMGVGKNLEIRQELELELFGQGRVVGIEATYIDRYRLAAVNPADAGSTDYVLEPPAEGSKMKVLLERPSPKDA